MNEIVRRLMRNNKDSVESLKESMKLEEADKDEDETESPEDDAILRKAHPKLFRDTPEDEGDSTSEKDKDNPEESEEEETEEEPKKVTPPAPKSENPLDNPYAVNFKLGNPVAIVHVNGTPSDMKGIIEGYDKEGFYRIKWEDGSTTNGITDSALSIVADHKSEEVKECICGSNNFVTEGRFTLCDDCGRILKESTLDNLTILDKKRPKGKRLIRSIPHDMSTATRPDISGTVAESADPEEEDDKFREFRRLIDALDSEFWTRRDEVEDSIEELGYEVLESNDEYVIIDSPDGDSEECLKVPLGGTSRTITLDFDRAKMI